MKKLVTFCLIGIFLISGCARLKELYGIQPQGKEEIISIDEIKVQAKENDSKDDTLKPLPDDIPRIEDIPKPQKLNVSNIKKADSKVILVKETELVSLKPRATDPDQDKLVFGFTAPLDQEGRWQTKYGDAGEYAVTISASDGTLTAIKEVLVIVSKKEEAPTIDESLPKESAVEAKENSKVSFSIKSSDLNKDSLTYSWKLDGKAVSAKDFYSYDISYEDAGQHTVKVAVTDGTKEASKVWSVKVENINRKPELAKILDIKVKENEKILLSPKAADPDKEDKVTYTIANDKFTKVGDTFEWKTSYDDAGDYAMVLSATDGKDSSTQTVKIKVENVNRPPVIEDITLG